MWVSGTSQFYSIEDVENSAKLSNTDSNDPTSDSTNKSVSKMRSYLKRCESAINSMNLSAKRSLSLSSPSTPTTSNDAAAATSKSTNSSWYVDEFEPEITESTDESNCTNGKSDERTQQQMETLTQSPDEQMIATQCTNENANDCTPKLPQHQVTVSPVSKKRNSLNKSFQCVTSKYVEKQ